MLDFEHVRKTTLSSLYTHCSAGGWRHHRALSCQLPYAYDVIGGQ